MWHIICQLNEYRRTFKKAPLPASLDGIGFLLVGYDACNGYDAVIHLNLFEAVKYNKRMRG